MKGLKIIRYDWGIVLVHIIKDTRGIMLASVPIVCINKHPFIRWTILYRVLVHNRVYK